MSLKKRARFFNRKSIQSVFVRIDLIILFLMLFSLMDAILLFRILLGIELIIRWSSFELQVLA